MTRTLPRSRYNDRENLTVHELADEKFLCALDAYRKYYAARDVRQRYLEAGELDSDGFHCRYVPEGWTEDSFLSYIADPLAYAEQEAERYWSENQEEMYLQFLEQDARDAEQAAIAENPKNPVHIVRQIMAVMNDSGAKTVNVTVRKDGKELTFKTGTGDLRRDCTDGYSHWHMIAADRRRFFECFGRSAEYSRGWFIPPKAMSFTMATSRNSSKNWTRSTTSARSPSTAGAQCR